MSFANWAGLDVNAVHAQFASRGYCRLDGLIPEPLLDDARQQAVAAVHANAGEYVSFTGPDQLNGELLHSLQADADFRVFCGCLYSKITGKSSESSEFYQVFRCLKGQGGQRHSSYLHFDSYAVTALIPIAMPTRGRRGELVLVSRRRPLRRSYLLSAAEKALLDQSPVQRMLWWCIRRGFISVIRLRLRPGSLYFFPGYQTLHANEPCDADQLRATLLFHYGNPHEKSASRMWLDQLRQRPTRTDLPSPSVPDDETLSGARDIRQLSG